jgi:hypothetical protein
VRLKPPKSGRKRFDMRFLFTGDQRTGPVARSINPASVAVPDWVARQHLNLKTAILIWFDQKTENLRE